MKAKQPTTKSATKRGSRRLDPAKKSTKRGGQDNRHYQDFIPSFGVEGAGAAFADAISAEWKRQTGAELGKALPLQGVKAVEENVAILLERHKPAAIGDRLPGLDAKTIKLILKMQAAGWVFQLEDCPRKGEMNVVATLEKELITQSLSIPEIEDYAARGLSLEKIEAETGYTYTPRFVAETDEAMDAVIDASQLLEFYALTHAGLDFAANQCEFDTKKATAILEKVLKWTRDNAL